MHSVMIESDHFPRKGGLLRSPGIVRVPVKSLTLLAALLKLFLTFRVVMDRKYRQ
jgi:hypothetical protein